MHQYETDAQDAVVRALDRSKQAKASAKSGSARRRLVTMEVRKALTARLARLSTRLREESSRVRVLERVAGELEEARKRAIAGARSRSKTTRLRPDPVRESDLDSDRASAGSASVDAPESML